MSKLKFFERIPQHLLGKKDRGIYVIEDYPLAKLLTVDDNKDYIKPIEADFIVCHASAPNYVSLRQ